MISLTLYFTLFLVCIALMKTVSQPLRETYRVESAVAGREPVRGGIGGFNGKIFRNRVKMCIPQLSQDIENMGLEKIPTYQTMRETMPSSVADDSSDDTGDEIRTEVRGRTTANEESHADDKNSDSEKPKRKDSMLRRFIRCVIGRTESLESIPYLKSYEEKKKEEEGLLEENSPKENSNECVEVEELGKINKKDEDGNVTCEEKELFIEENTEIKGRIRTVRFSPDRNEEMAIPGPSRAVVRIFPSVEAMQLAIERRNKKYAENGWN